ncbi:MAG: homoserine kinase [Alphaproteobacteria bacterium]|nr:homoserine kinase [Alphaproteobacteria bacterium]
MAVYTDVSDDALEEFLRLYNVGQLLWCKGIAEGVENTNYILATDKGQFILTLYEARVEENELPFFLGLMNHLAENGLETARPILQNDGLLFSRLCGKPAALIEFLDGMAIKAPSPQNLFQLGVASAQFHLKAESFKIKRKNGLSLKDWQPLLKSCGDDIDKVAPEVDGGLQKFLSVELDFLKKSWPKKLPNGVIHADLFPDNVFFMHGELSGIIDFYFACNEVYAYELAIVINAWCFEKNGELNLTKSRAFFRGYQSVRKLEQAELDAIPTLCRGAAIRFLLTRLYDWINVPEDALVIPKKPDEYIRNLRFHQKIGDYKEYGIE